MMQLLDAWKGRTMWSNFCRQIASGGSCRRRWIINHIRMMDMHIFEHACSTCVYVVTVHKCIHEICKLHAITTCVVKLHALLECVLPVLICVLRGRWVFWADVSVGGYFGYPELKCGYYGFSPKSNYIHYFPPLNSLFYLKY